MSSQLEQLVDDLIAAVERRQSIAEEMRPSIRAEYEQADIDVSAARLALMGAIRIIALHVDGCVKCGDCDQLGVMLDGLGLGDGSPGTHRGAILSRPIKNHGEGTATYYLDHHGNPVEQGGWRVSSIVDDRLSGKANRKVIIGTRRKAESVMGRCDVDCDGLALSPDEAMSLLAALADAVNRLEGDDG